MLTYVVRRLVLGVLTVWVVSVVAFVIIQLPPGDYLTAYVAQLSAQGDVVTGSEVDALRAQYGLGKPVYVQYLKWMGQIMRGNFGRSFLWERPVSEIIFERLLLTATIAIAAVLLTWVIALPIGIYSAVHQYSKSDYIFTVVGFIGLAVPNFLLALVIMYFGWAYLGISVGGLFSAEYADAAWSLGKLWDLLKHLWIPAFVVGTAGTASLMRIMRANLLDELSKPYVVTARAKGLSETKVLLKYPTRVALNPFVSMIGFTFPTLISGSIIVAVVLSLPTVGPVLLESLVAQDMFLAGSIVLCIGVMTVIGMLVSDILLCWLDPRIRMEGM